MLLRELRRRAHHFIGPSIAICAAAYFAYHMMQGERGFLAWQKLEIVVGQKEAELAELQRDHDILENRVKLLSNDSLCPDLLNECGKQVLGCIDSKEIMVMRSRNH